MLSLTNITKKYGDKNVLTDINLQLTGGKVVAFIGENGCGKSTLLKIILKLIGFCGNVSIEGKFANGLIETPCFFSNFTGKENLRAFLDKTKLNEEKLIEIATDFNIQDVLNSPVKKYSLGMKQKLAIIYILLSNPDILLFDEPTNALDQVSLATFKRKILVEKDKGKLIIIASHDYGYLDSFVDEAYELKDGKLFIDKSFSKIEKTISHLFCLDDLDGGTTAVKKSGCEFSVFQNRYIIINDWYLPSDKLTVLLGPYGIKMYLRIDDKLNIIKQIEGIKKCGMNFIN